MYAYAYANAQMYANMQYPVPRQPTPTHANPRQPTPTHTEPHPAARTPAAVISRDLALIDLRSDLAVISRDLATWAALPSTEQLQIYRTTQ